MTRDINMFPIGTVVVLHNSTAAVIIAGYLAESNQQPGYIWDYSGFIYPIGLRDESEVYTFDHTQIAEVLAMGYQDSESFGFMKKLKEIADKMIVLSEENKDEKEPEENHIEE